MGLRTGSFGLALLLFAGASVVATAGGAGSGEHHYVGGERLDLKATAVQRFAGLLKICRAALYGPPEEPGAGLHLQDVPKRLEIEYFVSVSREKIVELAEDNLREQFTEQQLRPFTEQIATLHALYRDVGRSDLYAMTYHPDRGLTLELNGEALGSIPGAGFARTYLSIWLGERPISPSLKSKLTRQS